MRMKIRLKARYTAGITIYCSKNITKQIKNNRFYMIKTADTHKARFRGFCRIFSHYFHKISDLQKINKSVTLVNNIDVSKKTVA